MKILVTGGNGYVGRPLVYALSLNRQNTVISIDNDSREEWVRKVEGYKENKNLFHFIDDNIINIKGDLTNQAFVNEIVQIHKPECVIHLASQPSMPYSQINAERALFTQMNNVSMCLNLLWAIKELETKPRFIVTTTTGVPGQYYKRIKEEPVANQAGSWYHVTRGFDSENCSLASRQFDLEIVEFRTAIVYGAYYDAEDKVRIETRFDTDFYFGTALNRFVDSVVKDKPITVYGKGEQTKPFVSLNDTVDSIINAITHKFAKKHTILNQTTHNISINQLAHILHKNTGCVVKHIENPRKENESHKMFFDNKEFLKVLKRKPQDFGEAIHELICYVTTMNGVNYGQYTNTITIGEAE